MGIPAGNRRLVQRAQKVQDLDRLRRGMAVLLSTWKSRPSTRQTQPA